MQDYHGGYGGGGVGGGGGKPAPAPIFNHRKRPRQAMFADPASQCEPPASRPNQGPDLMPVGGFPGNQMNRGGQNRSQGQKLAYGQQLQNQGPPAGRTGSQARTVGGNPTSSSWGQQNQNTPAVNYTNRASYQQRSSTCTSTAQSPTHGYQQKVTFTSGGQQQQQYNQSSFQNNQNNYNRPGNNRQNKYSTPGNDRQNNYNNPGNNCQNSYNNPGNNRQDNNYNNPGDNRQNNYNNPGNNRQNNNYNRQGNNCQISYNNPGNNHQQSHGYGSMAGSNQHTVRYGENQNAHQNYGNRSQNFNSAQGRQNSRQTNRGGSNTSSRFGSNSQYQDPGGAPAMPDRFSAGPGTMFNQATGSANTERDVQRFGQTSSRDTKSNKSQQKKFTKNTEKPSLRVLTAHLDTILKSAAVSEQLGPHMVEVFGVLDSAVVSDKSGTGREFVLRDETASLNCVFYEIDRNLPRLIRGQWQRCVGTLERKSGRLKCVSVRAARGEERQLVRTGQIQTEQVLASVDRMAHEQ